MHCDLLMLRVACRLVEEEADGTRVSTSPPTTTTTPAAAPHSTTMHHRVVLPASHMTARPPAMVTEDARRIPATQPTALATHAADLMLGLKRLTGAHKRTPVPHAPTDDHKHKRARRQPGADAKTRVKLPSPPGVFMEPIVSSHRLAITPTPPICSPLGVEGVPMAAQDDKSTARVAPSTFVSFLGHQQLDPRVRNAGRSEQPAVRTVDAQSDSSSDDAPSPTKSPRFTTASVPPHVSVLRVPTIQQWRAPPLVLSQGSPLPSLAAAPRPQPSLATPSMPTTQPTLVRKKSSQWRQEMPEPDREKTRSRVHRGLHSQSRGDYETLLRLVAAMEEELLHVHTTSADHYFFQTQALADRIDAVASSRTHQQRRTRPRDD